MSDDTTTAPTEAVIEARGLGKRYGEQRLFEGLDFEVLAGETLVILGASGSGKSTLLNCLAGLDQWQDGHIRLAGQDLGTLDEAGRARLRRHALGFVFQAFHVLPHLNVAQNLAIPLLLLAQRPRDHRAGWPGDPRVQQMLGAVELDGLATRMPAQLSGGQLQRVAIARALIHRPPVLLADEPTGNLDASTASAIMALLQQQTRAHGCALVLVTHAEQAAVTADRVLRLG